MRFANAEIFGTNIKQNGPIPKTRTVRENLPGVKGYRIYRLTGSAGPDTLTWTIKGRIIGNSLSSVIAMIRLGQSKLNSIGNFSDNAGNVYRNCELINYQQSNEYRRCSVNGATYTTVEITATIEQASE